MKEKVFRVHRGNKIKEGEQRTQVGTRRAAELLTDLFIDCGLTIDSLITDSLNH